MSIIRPGRRVAYGAGLVTAGNRAATVGNWYELLDFRTFSVGQDLCDEPNWEPCAAAWQTTTNKNGVRDNWDGQGTYLEFGTTTNGTSSCAQHNPGGNFYVQSWPEAARGVKPSTYWDGVRVWLWCNTDMSQSSASVTLDVAFSDPTSGGNACSMTLDRNNGTIWKGRAGSTWAAPATTLGGGAAGTYMEYDLRTATAKFCFRNSTASADWTWSDTTRTKVFTSVPAMQLSGITLASGNSAAGMWQKAYVLAYEFRAYGHDWEWLYGTTDPPN